MPKKGVKKKKKQDGLPDKFWALMPAPGTFNWFKVILFILHYISVRNSEHARML
jgi:hypothetical protein